MSEVYTTSKVVIVRIWASGTAGAYCLCHAVVETVSRESSSPEELDSAKKEDAIAKRFSLCQFAVTTIIIVTGTTRFGMQSGVVT